MAPVFATTIDNLLNQPEHPAIKKLIIISKVFADFKYKQDMEYLQAFKEKLIHITSLLEMPLLSDYGLKEEGIQKVVDCTSHKYHPVKLSDEQMVNALKARI
jgi:hypothetical protein